MDMREKTTEFGDVFMVPTWIERIGNDKNHGWQLRFGNWTYFTDGTNDGSGTSASLKRAIAELKNRIKSSAVPNRLKRNARKNKFNDFPVGISGPVSSRVTSAPDSDLHQYHLQVSVPRFGKLPTTKKVYIGTDNTYTDERFDKALIKAQSIRESAVKQYAIEHAADARKAVSSL